MTRLHMPPAKPSQDHRLYVTYDPDSGTLDAGVNNVRVYSRYTRDPQAHLDDLLDAITDKLSENMSAFLAPLNARMAEKETP